MEVRHVVGLLLLVVSVPLQMYLMRYNENFRELVAEIVEMLPKQMQGLTIDLTDYVKTANDYVQSAYSYFDWSKPPENDNDDPFNGKEIPEHLIQNFRPPHLEFRVGDVVLTQNMVVGAVVGWTIDKSDLKKEPEYFLLTEQEETLVREMQINMIPLESVQVKHDLISHYFEMFDGTRYIPKKYLQTMYPKD